MKIAVLIGHSLVISGALFMLACDKNESEQEKNYSKSKGNTLKSPVNIAVKKSKKAIVAIKPIVSLSAEEEGISELAEEFALEDNNQDEPIQLDLSLDFGGLEFNTLPNRPEPDKQRSLRGIFEPPESLTNIEVETHFEGPHNENKERETTPDGAGVEFKIGF